MGSALLGLLAPARLRGGEEFRQLPAPEVVAQHPEAAWRIAEAPRDLGRGQPLDVKGAQGLVLALARGRGSAEEAATIR